MDVDAIPQVGGQSLLDFDLEATIDRPWRLPGLLKNLMHTKNNKICVTLFPFFCCVCVLINVLPGSDISDFFNYGFTEETWRLYCEKQRKMRGELTQLNKIVVSTSTPPGALCRASCICPCQRYQYSSPSNSTQYTHSSPGSCLVVAVSIIITCVVDVVVDDDLNWKVRVVVNEWHDMCTSLFIVFILTSSRLAVRIIPKIEYDTVT